MLFWAIALTSVGFAQFRGREKPEWAGRRLGRVSEAAARWRSCSRFGRERDRGWDRGRYAACGRSPVDGIRHRTRIELSERDSKEFIAATREWVQQFDSRKKEDAHHLLEALWLHQQHNVKDFELLERVLNSPEPHARIAAKTVEHFWRNVEKTYRGGVIAAAELGSSQKSGILSDTPELTTFRIATVPEKMMCDNLL